MTDRATPNCSARARSAGSRSPRRSSPRAMRADSAVLTCLCSGSLHGPYHAGTIARTPWYVPCLARQRRGRACVFRSTLSRLRFRVAAPAEPLHVYEEGRPREASSPRTDGAGEALWRVTLVAIGDGSRGRIRVTVPGDPMVAAGDRVTVARADRANVAGRPAVRRVAACARDHQELRPLGACERVMSPPPRVPDGRRRGPSAGTPGDAERSAGAGQTSRTQDRPAPAAPAVSGSSWRRTPAPSGHRSRCAPPGGPKAGERPPNP